VVSGERLTFNDESLKRKKIRVICGHGKKRIIIDWDLVLF
jgi:hypothetical protein